MSGLLKNASVYRRALNLVAWYRAGMHLLRKKIGLSDEDWGANKNLHILFSLFHLHEPRTWLSVHSMGRNEG